MKNRVKEFLEERGLSAYRMIQDAGISDTTGYKLASDPSYVPSAKVLTSLCDTYKVQPGEIIYWVES